jgi:hypothetical protein
VITDTLHNNVPTFRLHALKLADLTDATPSLIIKASQTLTDGSTYEFDAPNTRSRSALLFLNGNVYAGFGSYCDFKSTARLALGLDDELDRFARAIVEPLARQPRGDVTDWLFTHDDLDVWKRRCQRWPTPLFRHREFEQQHLE